MLLRKSTYYWEFWSLYCFCFMLFPNSGIVAIDINELAARLTEGDVPNELEDVLDRASLVSDDSRWPKNSSGFVIVPYRITSEIDADRKSAILRAVEVFRNQTCVRFQPAQYETDYVEFFDAAQDKQNPLREGPCYSYIGRIGGRQPLSVGLKCDIKLGIILHEMNHALGIIHEQSRPDRDQYVTIHYTNIAPGNKNNFVKYGVGDVDVLNTQYDYTSVMHYNQYSFALRNGLPSIVTKDARYQTKIGQRDAFSACDLAKINRLYNCRAYPQSCPANDDQLAKSSTTRATTSTTAEPTTTTATASTMSLTTTTTTATTTATTTTTRKPSTVAPPTLFPSNTSSTCVEVHPQCWRAKLNATECDKYPGLFLYNCPLSCNNCDGKKCYDTKVKAYGYFCKMWATKPRQCFVSQIIQFLCPATCGYC